MEEGFQKLALTPSNEIKQEKIEVDKPVAGAGGPGPSATLAVDDKSSFARFGPRPGQLHSVSTFERDTEARTKDPEIMKNNYRIRIPLHPAPPAEGQAAVVQFPSFRKELVYNVGSRGIYLCNPFLILFDSLTATDIYRELIISPGFAAKFDWGPGKTIHDVIPNIEKYRGNWVCQPGTKRLKYTKSTIPPQHQFAALWEEMIKKKKTPASQKKPLSSATPQVSSKPGQLSLVKSSDSSASVGGKKLPSSSSLVTISVKGNQVAVGLESLKCLKPNTYLNDEIVNYFSLKCIQKFEGAGIRDFGFFPTYCWLLYIFKKLDSTLPENKQNTLFKIATDFGTQANLLQRKFFIIPVPREKHWFLVIVCRPFPDEALVNQVLKGAPWSKCSNEQAQEIYWKWDNHATEKPLLLVFDSMAEQMAEKCSNYPEFHQDTLKYIRKALLYIHQTFWRKNNAEKLAEAATIREMKYTSVKVAGQPNKADCGIFCIANALAWLIVTETLKMNYMDAIYLDFSLLFDHKDLGGERDKMFMDIKNSSPPEYHPQIDAVRTVVTVKDEPLDESFVAVPVQPTSKPFEQLYDLIQHNLKHYHLRMLGKNPVGGSLHK